MIRLRVGSHTATIRRSSVFKYKGRIVEPKLRNQSREKGTGSGPTLPKHTYCNRSFLSADHKRCSRGAARTPSGRPRRPALVAAANTTMQPQHYRNRQTEREVEQ